MIPPDLLAAALERAAAEAATEIRVTQCAVSWLDPEAAHARFDGERLLMEWAVAHPAVRIIRLLRHDLPAASAVGSRKLVLDRWLEAAVAWAAIIGADAGERLTILRVVDDELCAALADGVTWSAARTAEDRPAAALRDIRPGSAGTTRTHFTEFSDMHAAEFDEAQIYASIASL